MKGIIIIAKRELSAYFDSLVAYIMLILFLGFSGFFTWLYGNDIFIMGQADLSVFFAIAYWTLFFFIPALTMRLIAEERKTGTLELMLTKSVTIMQVLSGKFLSALLLIVLALLCTTPYVITLNIIGNPDNGMIVCGYLGLLFMSSAYLGIGIFASSVTGNQIVAFLLALMVGLCFHIIFGVLSQNLIGRPGELLFNLHMSKHFESMARGVIDTRDVLYFISIAAAGLLLAERQLNKLKITG